MARATISLVFVGEFEPDQVAHLLNRAPTRQRTLRDPSLRHIAEGWRTAIWEISFTKVAPELIEEVAKELASLVPVGWESSFPDTQIQARISVGFFGPKDTGDMFGFTSETIDALSLRHLHLVFDIYPA